MPSSLTGVGSSVFFSADDGSHGRELWRSDGTATGTTLVTDINPGLNDALQPIDSFYYIGRDSYDMQVIDNTVFFSADDGRHGRELWHSDGTAAGTTLVKDIFPGVDSSQPLNLTAVDQMLFFFC